MRKLYGTLRLWDTPFKPLTQTVIDRALTSIELLDLRPDDSVGSSRGLLSTEKRECYAKLLTAGTELRHLDIGDVMHFDFPVVTALDANL